LVPECNLAAFYPIGLSNTVVLDLGIAYYQYFKNTELNSGTPLINPNSELAFNVRAGDFTIRPSERFSYQESPVYETGGEFINVYNTGRFSRYENRIGATAAWDQHDLVVTFGYFHENLFSDDSFYDYINHASELFSADAMLAVLPDIKVGLEAAGSLNSFENVPMNDSWRVRFGPALRYDSGRFIRARFGAGYERINYNSSEAAAQGITDENTFYAYAGAEHSLSKFLSHSLQVSYDNQLGYNAGNLSGTHIIYGLNWRPLEALTLSPQASVNFFHETFGSGPPTLYHERFTYVLTGLAATYQLGQHWRSRLNWEYRLKDSDLPDAGYDQNQVALELMYQF
jgi:hypothetical protein